MTQMKSLWHYDTKEMPLVRSSECLEMLFMLWDRYHSTGGAPFDTFSTAVMRYDADWEEQNNDKWRVAGNISEGREEFSLALIDNAVSLCAKWVLSVFVIVIINYQAPAPKVSKSCHVKNV